MELIDSQRVPTKGGSLRGTAQLTGGPRKISRTVAELMALEMSLGLDHLESYKAFAAQMNAVKKELHNLLRNLKEERKTIAGYGAAVGVTTLIYHFDLGGQLNFLVDDNVSRQHLYSPGHHIPVLPPTVLYERKPAYVIILAWAYAEPIMKKHRAFLRQGGHFIVPLPKVEVI